MLLKSKVNNLELSLELKELVDSVSKNFRVLQEEEGYFRLRALEFIHVIKSGIFETKKPKIALEIGCGDGFLSVLLGRYCKRVLSIDLPYRNDLTHSKGIDRAKILIDGLGMNNVEVMGARAEQIPCRNSSLDLIYSHYVFDHILDFCPIFKEVNRVLKDEGCMVTIVPNLLNRIIWVENYIFSSQLIKNYLAPFYYFCCRKKTLKDSFNGFYWTIPPHDRRFSFCEEVKRYRITNWIKMFKTNGHDIISIISIRNDAVGFLTQKAKS